MSAMSAPIDPSLAHILALAQQQHQQQQRQQHSHQAMVSAGAGVAAALISPSASEFVLPSDTSNTASPFGLVQSQPVSSMSTPLTSLTTLVQGGGGGGGCPVVASTDPSSTLLLNGSLAHITATSSAVTQLSQPPPTDFTKHLPSMSSGLGLTGVNLMSSTPSAATAATTAAAVPPMSSFPTIQYQHQLQHPLSQALMVAPAVGNSPSVPLSSQLYNAALQQQQQQQQQQRQQLQPQFINQPLYQLSSQLLPTTAPFVDPVASLGITHTTASAASTAAAVQAQPTFQSLQSAVPSLAPLANLSSIMPVYAPALSRCVTPMSACSATASSPDNRLPSTPTTTAATISAAVTASPLSNSGLPLPREPSSYTIDELMDLVDKLPTPRGLYAAARSKQLSEDPTVDMAQSAAFKRAIGEWKRKHTMEFRKLYEELAESLKPEFLKRYGDFKKPGCESAIGHTGSSDSLLFKSPESTTASTDVRATLADQISTFLAATTVSAAVEDAIPSLDSTTLTGMPLYQSPLLRFQQQQQTQQPQQTASFTSAVTSLPLTSPPQQQQHQQQQQLSQPSQFLADVLNNMSTMSSSLLSHPITAPISDSNQSAASSGFVAPHLIQITSPATTIPLHAPIVSPTAYTFQHQQQQQQQQQQQYSGYNNQSLGIASLSAPIQSYGNNGLSLHYDASSQRRVSLYDFAAGMPSNPQFGINNACEFHIPNLSMSRSVPSRNGSNADSATTAATTPSSLSIYDQSPLQSQSQQQQHQQQQQQQQKPKTSKRKRRRSSSQDANDVLSDPKRPCNGYAFFVKINQPIIRDQIVRERELAAAAAAQAQAALEGDSPTNGSFNNGDDVLQNSQACRE
ncbi:hypothetical protein GQ42DRAFT_155941 [Ramicandelaber brevisporus]|nr:hypothetical protein GQ42DRAFT_155941 [Ramicandelaber brevisporus]